MEYLKTVWYIAVMPCMLELFLILVISYGITYDVRKITEKTEFNETFASVRLMKLRHECDVSHFSTAR